MEYGRLQANHNNAEFLHFQETNEHLGNLQNI